MLIALRVLFFIIAAPTLLLAAVLFLSLSSQARTPLPYTLSTTQIKTITQLFDTISSQSKPLKKQRISQQSLEHALNYFLQRYVKSATQVKLIPQQIKIKSSLQLPQNTFGIYLNINFSLQHTQQRFILKDLHLGKLKIANEFSEILLQPLLKYSPLAEYYLLGKQQIKTIAITEKALQLNATHPQQQTHQHDLFFYQQKLDVLIKHRNSKQRLSLAELFQPLFKIALQRSTLHNAIQDNKRILIVVSRYVNQHSIPFYRSQSAPVFAYQRTDIVKHFINSALLTIASNKKVAYLIGEKKELSDAQQGSGFSFIDLASNKAGIVFGIRATINPQSARQIQRKMAVIKNYRTFMPEILDLPEKLSKANFEQQFESVHSPQYQAMLKKIDARIAALPIYQP